ncbi:MAG TPA: hypothetical protein VM305_09225 [Candidatus Limnocylindrales bacterium]|nr:hypothetical protein [Candidatus Limnocylindrales bacterium]
MSQVDHLQLLGEMRNLMRSGAHARVEWIRDNVRRAMAREQLDAATLGALSGVSPGTVRGFLTGTDSSISHVIQIALALGLTLSDLERPPDGAE